MLFSSASHVSMPAILLKVSNHIILKQMHITHKNPVKVSVPMYILKVLTSSVRVHLPYLTSNCCEYRKDVGSR